MKWLLFVFIIIILGCNNSDKFVDNDTVTESTVQIDERLDKEATIDSTCYLRIEGKNNKDTFALKLVTQGNRVTGKLKYLYYEKDWRIGNLTGIRKGDIVNAKWVYIQEGQIDSTDVSFRLDANNAYQKSSFYDNVTGREILSDTGSYIQQYPKVDCAAFPKYDFDFGL